MAAPDPVARGPIGVMLAVENDLVARERNRRVVSHDQAAVLLVNL